MAIEFSQLEGLFQQVGFRIFSDPSHSVIRFGVRGIFGPQEFFVVLGASGGTIGIRTVRYLELQPGQPNAAPTLELMAMLNHRFNLIRFAWDRDSSEVVAYSELLLVDNTATPLQFAMFLQGYLVLVDLLSYRLRTVLQTGKDPGMGVPPSVPLSPEQRAMIEGMMGGAGGGGSGLPTEI
jgi:hypothetical protein